MKMKILFITLITIAFMSSCKEEKTCSYLYPTAAKVDTVDVYFGHQVADPYRWLEDDNSEQTAEWVKAENKITFDYLSKIPFREELKKKLTKIWNYPKYDVPFQKGGRLFYFKNDGVQNQDVLYMQQNLDAEPEVLLDPNLLSEDGTVALAGIGISKNGKYFAYSVARGGSDWNEIYVMEIDGRKMLEDHIEWVKFSGISWKGDGFFYSSYDKPEEGDELSAQNRFHKVYYHKVGTPQNDDKLIFEDKENAQRNFYAYLTDDEEFVFVSESESTSGNSLYAAKAKNVDNLRFKKIAEGFDYEYSIVDNIGDKLLMKTNYEAAKSKLLLVDFNKPELENWETLVGEKEEVLESAGIIGGQLFTQYLKDASSQAYFYDLKGNLIHQMELPAIGTLSGFSGEKENNLAFYEFASFTFPPSVYIYDVKAGQSTAYKSSDVEFSPKDYVTEQKFYPSKDGTMIPMFIVHKKGIALDGNNPTMLYAYGGFNVSLTPSFNISRIPFLENGGIYVMANLRGGGEYGEDWHEAGTKLKKQNVFDDFIFAANYLIKEKYTSSDKLAIIGGSNGGLLIGAVMVQEPELFKVAIPIVGVMDMLRYQNFTIGWAWASDFGTSADSEEMFNYLYGYSPLHNIKEGVVYPATLAITADHDDRVVPAHTFKFMATLQENASCENPALVRIETKAGHGAGKPTDKQIEESADLYSFMMYNLGMKPNF